MANFMTKELGLDWRIGGRGRRRGAEARGQISGGVGRGKKEKGGRFVLE